MEDYQWVGREWGGKGTENKSIIGRHKIDKRRLRIIQGIEAKELIGRTHGHDLRWVGCKERKGRKNCDNCNSIINKIFLKNKKIKIIRNKNSTGYFIFLISLL